MGNNIESLRKILVTGLGAILMSEEGILKLISDMKLPRDAKKYILSQAQKRKEDVSRVIGREVKSFLEHVDIHEELRKAVMGLKIDVAATINIDQSGPRLKTRKVRTTRRRKTIAYTKK